MQGIEKALSTEIRTKKIKLWIDKNELYPTEIFDSTIFKQIKKADMVLLLLSNDFWSSDYIQIKELPLILKEHRERGLLIFPIILRDIADFTRHKELDGIFACPFDDEGNLVTVEDFEIKDRAYNKIAIRIEKINQELLQNPYKHLSYFEEKDSQNFYGRERLAKELANTTITLKAGLIFGESGVGKTSLILAGVLVELNRADSFKSIYIRCRKDILRRFKEILIEKLESEAFGIKEILQSYIREHGSSILLIFDQFEEIFTTLTKYEERKFFRDILLEIKEIEGVHLLFSLRADYLWRLNPYRVDFGELWNRSVGLERLEKEDALRAIVQPLKEENIDKSLAHRIYHDLLSESKTEQVHTPFLQLVMFELYVKAISRDSQKITTNLYRELGGVHGIITNYFDGLLKNFDAHQHKSLERLFYYLVTDSFTRDSLKKESLETIFESRHERVEIYHLIDILIQNRIIRRVTDGDEYYELVHDILAGHIGKRFNLRQNIKHLTNRLDYLDIEDSTNRYLSEKELYEIIIYQELFDFQEKHYVQIIRNIIKYRVKIKAWIEKHQKLFYKVVVEFITSSSDNTHFILALQAVITYKELIDDELKDRVYREIGTRFKHLNNTDSETYWILNLLIELSIEPNSQELALIEDLAQDFNSSFDILQKSILLILKYNFENQKFIETLESDILFDFIPKREQFVKEIFSIFIQHKGIKGYLVYLLDKLEIYASDMFDDEDDDVLIYQYALIMVESLCEYIKKNDSLYLIKSSKETEKIEDRLSELYAILALKIDMEYEKIFERLEKILLGGVFEFNGTILVNTFINQTHPPSLNKKVAFDLAPAIPYEALGRIISRLYEDDYILRQNAYFLLRYRFDEIVEMDLNKYQDIKYDEINLFLNFDSDIMLFDELNLSNKDIQIKRLELYWNSSIAYKQFVVWESYLDRRLQQLNQNIDKTLKNIMVGSLEMRDKNFREIKSSLESFLSFFKIELMFDKLSKHFKKLNSSKLNQHRDKMEKEIKEYINGQLENQKRDVRALTRVINQYQELERELDNLSDLDFLGDVRADIKFMQLYIEATDIDITFDYWLDYITDVIYLLTQQSDRESLRLKEKLLQKMIQLQMYDNIRVLFKDIISKTDNIHIEILENNQDWHIQDTLLESYYDLKIDIPYHNINLLLDSSQVRIRQFAFRLLMLNSKIDNNIKREVAFSHLDNITLRIFALELLAEVGRKEDILRLLEYRGVQDLDFGEKLGWCVGRVFGNFKKN